MSDQQGQLEMGQSVPIAYVLQSFPLLTETFVYREVQGLRGKGLPVSAFAIWEPDRETLSQEARHLLEQSTYVFPISWSEFVKAHLSSLGRHPRRYVRTLRSVLMPRGESWNNRRRTLFHFCEAVYLAEEMRKQQIKHIHAHFCINAATIALVASRLLDIPFSFTAHNLLFTDRILLRQKIRAASFVVAISDYTRHFLIDQVPDDGVEDKIQVIHCGISPDAFVPREPQSVSDVPTVLFVAQLCERKGAPFLIEACRILVERGVRFRCVIAGDGPQWSLVEHLVERHGLERRIELLGAVFQEDLGALLHQADTFVLPCITASNGDLDGVPVSLMEAMAVELAVVSTHVSGIPELIEHDVSGLLVPEKDALALAYALQRLLENKDLRSTLGQNARRKVMDQFNIDKSVSQLARLFRNSA